MFIVYCLEEENDSEEEDRGGADCLNALNLLYNLDLPHVVIKVGRKDKRKQAVLNDLISRSKETPAPDASLPLMFPQIFSLDVLEENEDIVVDRLLNFEDAGLSQESLFYIGGFNDFRELILRLLRLSPDVISSDDDVDADVDSSQGDGATEGSSGAEEPAQQ